MSKRVLMLVLLLATFLATPVFAAPEYKVGQQVMVKRDGKWSPARIVEKKSATVYRVHYLKRGDKIDVEIPVSDMKPYEAKSTFSKGDKVMVLRDRKYYKAIVVECCDVGYKVHYVGKDSRHDEVVPGSRIKRR